MLPDLLLALQNPALVLAAGLSCAQLPAMEPTTIEVKMQEPKVTHSLTHEQLGVFQTDTQVSHGPNDTFQVGGLTEGGMRATFEASFKQLTSSNGQACLGVNKVHVVLTYEPVVHIALNFPLRSCKFNQTWLHELKHVNTDKITLNEQAPAIQAAVHRAALHYATQGPFDAGQMTIVQDATVAGIQAALKAAFDDMDALRMQRQQLVDTREEYMRISNLCAHEK